MRSVKLENFRETLIKQLDASYPDYKINEYFNTEYSSISWLRVSDIADNAKVLTIAEVIAVEKFVSRDDETSLLVIDYVNSDSRRFTNIESALSFMRSILASALVRRNETRIASNEKQCEQEPVSADEITAGTIDPSKYYLVTGRGSGKLMLYHAFLRHLFGLKIKDVIFNDPATIVFWEDGEKTIVQCQNGEEFDPEKGLAMAITKKIFGNKHSYYDVFKKWVGKYNKKKLRESKQVQTKEETVIANLTLSEVSLSPEDAVAVLRADGEAETKNPREGTDFNDYLTEQLKDPAFKKQFENTEILKPYCDQEKENDGNADN